jgi:flagellar protein FliL
MSAAPAPKEEAPAAPAPAAPAGGGGMTKGQFMGVAGALVVVMAGLGFGLAFFLLPGRVAASLKPAGATAEVADEHGKGEHGKDEKAKDEHAKDEHGKKEEGKKESTEKQVTEFTLNELLVNVNGSRGGRYLKISLHFECPEDVVAELHEEKAKIIDFVSLTLSSKTIDELTSPNARGMIRTELVNGINPFLKSGQVKNIYFLEFIIQ